MVERHTAEWQTAGVSGTPLNHGDGNGRGHDENESSRRIPHGGAVGSLLFFVGTHMCEGSVTTLREGCENHCVETAVPM